MKSQTRCNFYLPVVAIILALPLGTAAATAQENSVKMTFSGTAGSTAANLQIQNEIASDYNFSGKGTLGSFDFHSVSASVPAQQPSTCSGSMKIYAEAKAGPAVFRFGDGSLLTLTLTHGFDCIDLQANQALCLRVFQITGGTGRFVHASGTLTFTETLVPVPSDLTQNLPPVLYAATGVIEGTVSGVGKEEGHGEDR